MLPDNQNGRSKNPLQSSILYIDSILTLHVTEIRDKKLQGMAHGQ